MMNLAETAAGGRGLPCTKTNGVQRCPHWTPPEPITPQCLAALQADCGTVQSDKHKCAACISAHGKQLKAAGCPRNRRPVVSAFCGKVGAEAGGPPHSVCDLKLESRLRMFG